VSLVSVIGRLKPGVTLEQSRANLEWIARGMDRQYPVPWSTYHASASVRIVSLQEQLTSSSRTAIKVLMGAVFFILLIVCVVSATVVSTRILRPSTTFFSCAIATTLLWMFSITSGPRARAHLFMTVSSGTSAPPTRVKER
jgi:hypothetical protein